MRQFTGLLVVIVVFAVQMGLAHATVCKNLMAPAKTSAQSHCGSMKAKADRDCAGKAGCRDLCKQEHPTAPQASIKTGADSVVLLQADGLAPQPSTARTCFAADTGLTFSQESPPGGDGVPDAFLLHHAFLI